MLHSFETEMNLCRLSVTALLFSFTIFCKLIDASYIGDVAINCGYHGSTTALDGRQWFGDVDSSSYKSMLQPRGHSRTSIPHQKSLSADPIPYMTARTSATQFYYSFQVNPGQKFIRLHFYPSSSYHGFENSLDFFSVKAGPLTLLRNFSASLAADAMGVNYIVKEFCVNVEENEFLNLTFTPTQSSKRKNYHAYVNGIEIIAMPTGLYFTPDDDLGARVVGQSNGYFRIDNTTALETLERLNIGGSSISPVEDFGMFRRWNADSNYLLGSKLQPVNHLVPWTNTGLYAFSAPQRIFLTSWQTAKNGRTDNAYYNFTWKIPVDLGFGYLVRLHFCDFAPVEREGKGIKVNVLIDNQVAETVVDVIRLSGRNGLPIYRDYMVTVEGDEVDKYDLFVALQSSDELAIELLRGLEILKLSNLDNNLASKNETYVKQVSAASRNLNTKHFLSAFDRKNTIVTVITILLILLNLIVSKLRQHSEESNCYEEDDSQSASRKQSCRKFSLDEIILATQNFSDSFLIGKGGFGYVYKGFIRGGSETVAIKRLKANSKQGAREFWTEIETLSSIRHKHLVSLVGYCNEYPEMILVYEYMPCGTLADNLYETSRNGEDGTCLTWEQRLSICIGAARGLDYLHAGIEYEIIHRDVKDSNILLDKNFVAKISDFGLSKLRNVSESQGNLSTKVRGTPGFVDPDYFMTHKPTTKTDVYAFGVVMLVVLCGRPAIDRSIPWEPRILLSLFKEHKRKGDVNDIVDPSMQGKISTQSLNEFIKSLENCLHFEPRERPTMSEVATSLEWALEKQQSTMSCNPEEAPAATSASGKSIDDEFVQSFRLSPIQEGGFTSSPMERTTGEIMRAIFRKTFISSAMEALRKKRKTSRKQDSFLEFPEYAHFARFTLRQIKEATDNFGNRLRQDSSWVEYVGYMLGGSEIVAVKSYRTDLGKRGREEFFKEMMALSKIKHINLVPILGYCSENREMILVQEYMSRGTLADNIYKMDGNGEVGAPTPLTWEQRLRICIGAARGLDCLHNCGIIHRDVKCSNILLDENMVAKMADIVPFRMFSESESLVYAYYDPAYLSNHMLTKKSDVYSFGVVMLVVLCGRSPFIHGEETRMTLAQYFLERGRLAIEDIIDPTLEGIISPESKEEFVKSLEKCVQLEPEKRPTMSQLVVNLENALELQLYPRTITPTIMSYASESDTLEKQQSTMSCNPEEAPAATSASRQSTDALPPLQGEEIKGAIFGKTSISSAMEALWKKRKTLRKQDPFLEFLEYEHFPRFTLSQIREATGNFVECLRQDSSWVEYRGSMLGGSKIVAVKRFRKSFMGSYVTNFRDRAREEFWKEILTLSKIKHINLVSILGYCSENHEMILVQEYISRATLADYFYEMDGNGEVGARTPLTWEQRLRICIGAACGLDYLHNRGIMHRDVKCSNILLDENMVAKIADIGQPKMLGERDIHLISTGVFGRLGYLDPNYLLTYKFTKKSDVYSFGVVMLVVLCGRSPLIDDEKRMAPILSFRVRGSDEEIIDPTLKGTISSGSLGEFVRSLGKCLQFEPEKRPTMSQLVVSLKTALAMQTTAMFSASESDALEEATIATTLPESAFLTSLSGPL